MHSTTQSFLVAIWTSRDQESAGEEGFTAKGCIYSVQHVQQTGRFIQDNFCLSHLRKSNSHPGKSLQLATLTT